MTASYAGFWRRAVALWIDSAILNAVATLLVALLAKVYGLEMSEIEGMSLQLLSVLAYLVLAFPYYTIGHYRWGFTLGKRLLGVRVIDAASGQGISAGQSVARTLASVLSYLVFGLGYLMCAWDSEKRTLHDRLCGTRCVRLTAQA